MYLTPTQLSSMRSRPHRTRLSLAIYQPTTVFSAKINHADISKGEREITVTSIAGVAIEVERGMTCYIGTLAGGRDIGRIRAISATNTTITIAENSYIWTDGWFLTIVKYFEPWAVYPRITLDADNVPEFYKDYDIPYTDQNQYFEPVVNMGPNHAGYLETYSTGTYEQVWYTASGTFDPTPGGSISSYDWKFEGGMPTGSTLADPGWVEYTGSGYYLTRLRAISASGKTGTSYRHIAILDRPGGSGANEPIKAWGIRGFSGSREQGGYNVGIWVREAADLSVINDGSLCVIFSEDWESGTEVNKIGANAENRGSILYCGYILEETVERNPITSNIEFETNSVTGRMNQLATFAASLESKVNAMTWNEIREMTIDRAVIHFMRWHSTVLSIADFSQTDDEKQNQFADFERGLLFDSMNNLLINSLLGRAVSDRQGKIWCDIEANVRPTGTERQVSNDMQDILAMNNSDWRSQIGITRHGDADLAYLEMGGIHYSGPSETGTNAAYLSGAPGEAPDYHGDVERVSGLVVSSQEQLNALTGLAWANKNALYPEVDVPLAGDYRFLDIAPQQRVLMNLAELDTFRRIVWVNKAFIPQEMSINYRAVDQSLLTDVTLLEETGGDPGYGAGTTIVIPEDPPYTQWRIPEYTITFPPIIPISPWTPPIPGGNGWDDGGIVFYAKTNNSIVRTRDVTASSPIWESVGGPLISGSFSNLMLSASDPKNKAYGVNTYGVFYTHNLDDDEPDWHVSLTRAQMVTLVGEAAARFSGVIAVTLADPSMVAASVIYNYGADVQDAWFIWTHDVTAGGSWSATKIVTEQRYPLQGQYQILISHQNAAKVGCRAGGTFQGSPNYIRTDWQYSDSGPAGGWDMRPMPKVAFEDDVANMQAQGFSDDSIFYSMNKRNGEHHWRSVNGGASFGAEILPAVTNLEYANNYREAIVISRSGGVAYFCGRYDETKSGICYHDVASNKIVSIINADTFRYAGYGYGIWPFADSTQWIRDGVQNKIWLTEDLWATKREITGNITDFGTTYHDIQPVWISDIG